MPLIIIDRKHKRKNFDYDWTDAMGTEDAKREKAKSLYVDKDSDNPIDKFLMKHDYRDHKALLGKKVWCVKSDKSRFFEGYIMDVYPSRILLVKCNGNNLPMQFDSVISIED